MNPFDINLLFYSQYHNGLHNMHTSFRSRLEALPKCIASAYQLVFRSGNLWIIISDKTNGRFYLQPAAATCDDISRRHTYNVIIKTVDVISGNVAKRCHEKAVPSQREY